MSYYTYRMSRVVTLYNEGRGLDEIAQRFCVSRSTILGDLRKYRQQHPVARRILSEDPALDLMMREL